ncbi:ParA family protein [Burkholderia savannae]|uniref:ParA family protein n=1 Tax=Burkholderia savannae TaxID=1637837 RepID=UPI0009E74417|nr:AAA family ATPase [Burkholderia savannae]
MQPKIISVFNNKGGVGKTTLTFHLGHALAELGHKVLMVDLDPQCNLSIYGIPVDKIQAIWDAENPYIDEPGFADTRKIVPPAQFQSLCTEPRTMHFLLKPTEEGTAELDSLPPPVPLAQNLDLIPGRLTLHMYEEMISRRWSDAFIGQPLALRTLGEMRRLILAYAKQNNYQYCIVDTSPSLGPLNKVALSTVDAFLVPCAPDLFSLYGVRNIGNSLQRWSHEFKTLYTLISPTRRNSLPERMVRFLGYTVYNAKLRTGATEWDMAIAHYDYARQISETISAHVPTELSAGIDEAVLREPIGGTAVMHTHNTFPSHAQKYHCPMWRLPTLPNLEAGDQATIQLNRDRYLATQGAYHVFAKSVVERTDDLSPTVEAHQ